MQTLIIKLLFEDKLKGTFPCILCRGCIQFIISLTFIYSNNINGTSPKLFGENNYVRVIMFLRSVIGAAGNAFAFLAVETLPVGDSTVLVMLSPFFAAIGGFIVLGEPWQIPEFVATIISLIGGTLIARPSYFFNNLGGHVHPADPVGVVYALIASLSAGTAYVLVRMLGTVAKMPWANVCFAHAIGQIILAISALILSEEFFQLQISIRQAQLIFTAGFVGAGSQIAMTYGMQREKSATATAMRMSDVLFGFIWQALYTSDNVSALSLVGAALVSGSILIIVVFKPVGPQGLQAPAVDVACGNQANTMTYRTEPRSNRTSEFSLETIAKTIRRLWWLSSTTRQSDIESEQCLQGLAHDDDDGTEECDIALNILESEKR